MKHFKRQINGTDFTFEAKKWTPWWCKYTFSTPPGRMFFKPLYVSIKCIWFTLSIPVFCCQKCDSVMFLSCSFINKQIIYVKSTHQEKLTPVTCICLVSAAMLIYYSTYSIQLKKKHLIFTTMYNGIKRLCPPFNYK